MGIRHLDKLFSIIHTTNALGTGMPSFMEAAKSILIKPIKKVSFDETSLTSLEIKEEQKNETVRKATEDKNINLVEFLKIVTSDDKLQEAAKTHGYGTLFGSLDADHDSMISEEELQKLYGNNTSTRETQFKDISDYLINNVSQNSTDFEDITSIKKLKKLKETTQDELAAQTANLNEIFSQDFYGDEVLNDLKQSVSDAKAAFEQSVQNCNSLFSNFLKMIFDRTEEKMALQDATINEQSINMNNAQNDMIEQYGNLCNVSTQISEIDSAISELEAQKSEREKEGKSTTKYDEKINEFKEQKENLEAQKTEFQEAYEAAYTRYITSKNVVDKTKEEMENTMGNISFIAHRIEELGYTETSDALKAYIDAQENFRNAKNERAEEIRTNIAEISKTLFDIDTRISALNSQRIEQNKHVSTMGDDVVDFACQYEGKTASEMRKIILAAGCSFNSSWCADFVKYALKTKLGDNIPEWCKSSRCKDIQAEGDKHAVRLEDNLAEAKRGDIVLFDWNGDGYADHVGIIDYIEFDDKGNVIAVHTIEGNSTDGTGESRVIKLTYTYDENAGTYSSIKSIIRVYSLEQKKDDDDETKGS